MQYITDIEETFRILGRTLGEPVYKSIGKDEDGNEIAIPVFMIGDLQDDGRR